jgi:hypothetical protein
MAETRVKGFAESVMARAVRNGGEDVGPETDATNNGTRERQANAGAFGLEVIFKDGRRRQSFPWSHYAGHEWTDDGGLECLTVLFGMHVLIIRGHNFESLNRDLALGKRASIRQHNGHQVQLLQAENADNLPVIVEIEAHPNYRQIVGELKGDDERDTGKSGKAAR